MLRLLTAGESHGPQLTVILDGLPAGIPVDPDALLRGMARRQVGFGRGNRQRIEKDMAECVAGIRFGRTTGAPIALVVKNRDHENWSEVLSPFGDPPRESPRRLTRPRPGHADLVGMLKYAHHDARDVLERASARETAARVAAGEVLRLFLGELGVSVHSHVIQIGEVKAELQGFASDKIFELAEANDLRTAGAYEAMRAAIEEAQAQGDTLGGIFEVVVEGLPPGLGSSMAPDRKLDARLAAAMLSIPAVKGMEIGPAFANSALLGSAVHDEIVPVAGKPPKRASNRAGGLEGGMTTGEALVLRGAMKPISTLKKALRSVDMERNLEQKAAFERSDVCAVPAAGVVGEAVVMFVLAEAFLESYAGDTLARVKSSLERFSQELQERMRAAETGGDS
ncbi:MAG TPA: chorismate synthase [Candidatus Krumholzibacteria bacterium]|nr:chorismate synthase [Candidatus Krumholzibacteria bacterium]